MKRRERGRAGQEKKPGKVNILEKSSLSLIPWELCMVDRTPTLIPSRSNGARCWLLYP